MGVMGGGKTRNVNERLPLEANSDSEQQELVDLADLRYS